MRARAQSSGPRIRALQSRLRLRKEHAPIAILCVATVIGAIAGYRSRAALGRHDEPVPLNEARSEIAMAIDLAPRIACDEVFDLELYKHSGVELITWDGRGTDSSTNKNKDTYKNIDTHSCRGRHVVVKYVPGRIRRAALLNQIERLAVSVRVD